MMVSNIRPVLLLATALSGAMFSSQAGAQAVASTAPADATEANEIIVTAQRRAQRLEDVPIAMTAIQGDALNKSGIARVFELGQVVAGAQINRSGGFTQPAIRGVTTLTTGWGFENGVAIYIDGFYQTDTVSINNDFANLSSIQVLKGPQGTLYGRNAMAGAIVIETLAPSEDALTAKGQIAYGRFHDLRVQGYASGPIANGIAFSIAGYNRHSDGYQRDIGNDPFSKADDYNAAEIDSRAIRAKLQLKPTDGLSVTLGFNNLYSSDARSLIYTIWRFPSPALPLPPFRATMRDKISNNGVGDVTAWKNEGTATIKFDTGIGTLSSYTSYSKAKFRDKFDFDGSKAQITYTIQPKAFNYAKTFQQGIDYAINAIKNVDLVVGGLYYKNHFLNSSQSFANNILQRQTRTTLKGDAYAFYADATLRVTDRLSLTGGLRYSHEKKFISYFELPAAVPLAKLNPPLAGKTANFHGLTPRANIRYELAPRTNVYASYGQGFRSGVFNPSPAANPLFVIPIKPEKITSYEVGFKTASRTIRFDTAAYYYVYKNLQVGVTVPNPANPASVINLTSNAKRAEGYGAEAQLGYTPVEDLNLRTGVAYIHARYKDFKNATAIGWNATTGLNVTSQTQDWSGHQMARAPTWAINAGGDYTFDFISGRLNLTANASYTASFVVRDPSLWGPLAGPALANKQRYRQSAYVMVNGQINWTDPSDHFTLGVFCDNCTGTRYQIVATGGAFGDIRQFSDPFSFGVRAGFKI